MGKKPNIVLISADSIRADYCGFIEPTFDTTPALTEMATEGVRFTNAMSPAPRTPSSIPEIMTGRSMPNDRVDPGDWKLRRARIAHHMANGATMAERLCAEGYSTYAFTSNPWTETSTNFDRGFESFRRAGKRGWLDLNIFGGTRLEHLSKPVDNYVNRFVWRPVNGVGPFARWPQYVEDVLSVTESADEPYFLWVFLLDTHSPFIIPREDRTESSLWDMCIAQVRANSFVKDTLVGGTTSYKASLTPKTVDRLRAMYRDAIRSVDRFVATVRDRLEEDDPMIVFHSDHGEAFGEHGTFGHQRVLYEENVRVPLLVYNGTSTGTVEDVVSLRDLSDMIVSLVENETPVDDERWQTGKAVLRTEDNSKFGIRTDRWKYVQGSNDEKLYDLLVDPDETTNVADGNPERAVEYRRLVESYTESLPQEEPYDDQHVDSTTEARLRDLGYIE